MILVTTKSDISIQIKIFFTEDIACNFDDFQYVLMELPGLHTGENSSGTANP